MAMYALALVPLLQELKDLSMQVWFADDGTAGDSFEKMRRWDALCEKGPAYGYFRKTAKTWLIAREDTAEEGRSVFEGSGVQITTEGTRHLGAVIETIKFKKEYLGRPWAS